MRFLIEFFQNLLNQLKLVLRRKKRPTRNVSAIDLIADSVKSDDGPMADKVGIIESGIIITNKRSSQRVVDSLNKIKFSISNERIMPVNQIIKDESGITEYTINYGGLGRDNIIEKKHPSLHNADYQANYVEDTNR